VRHLVTGEYHIRQIIRGGKLLQIFANCKCFTIENFPWISVPSTNYTKHGTTSSYKQRAVLKCYVARDLLCYHFLTATACISISRISLFSFTNQLSSNYRCPAHMITRTKLSISNSLVSSAIVHMLRVNNDTSR